MRLLALVAALGALGAYQVWWFGRETPTERRLAEVAGSIAGRDVDIYCPSVWRRLIDVSGFKGEAHFSTDEQPYAKLAHDVCETFEDISERGFPHELGCLAASPPTCDEWATDLVVAVHTLSHEAWHLRGVVDEGTTECFAFQTDAQVARTFGAPFGVAEQLAAFAASRGAQAALPQYRPPAGCNPGGALDLHPDTSAWPS